MRSPVEGSSAIATRWAGSWAEMGCSIEAFGSLTRSNATASSGSIRPMANQDRPRGLNARLGGTVSHL